MSKWLAFMMVPVEVDLDVKEMSFEVKAKVSENVAEQLKADGWGGAELYEMAIIPETSPISDNSGEPNNGT